MQNDIMIWAASVVAALILFRLLTRASASPRMSEYEAQLNDILTNDKYKVKGRFE